MCCSVFYTFRAFLPGFARSKCGTPTVIIAFSIIRKKVLTSAFCHFPVRSALLYPFLNEGYARALSSLLLHNPGLWTNLSVVQKTTSNYWFGRLLVKFSCGKIIDFTVSFWLGAFSDLSRSVFWTLNAQSLSLPILPELCSSWFTTRAGSAGWRARAGPQAEGTLNAGGTPRWEGWRSKSRGSSAR